VYATAADIEATLSLPASPRLILHVPGGTGQVTVGGWRIALEGRVISEDITPTFATGLAVVFAIYYIFNLQYQDEAACTLEFIQRERDKGQKRQEERCDCPEEVFCSQHTRVHATEESP
ncbi:hypothetical protein XENORESO_006842, partial [Xenotaenia resolanae]